MKIRCVGVTGQAHNLLATFSIASLCRLRRHFNLVYASAA
jgi:hypothetical protein